MRHSFAALATAPLVMIAPAVAGPIDPAALPRVATVDPRYQSYNIEMVEVTGGRFWKPYRLGPPKDQADRYAYRPAINLANPRLVTLAKALGPAYVRVSGTWANTTYFADTDSPPAAVPAGLSALLTRVQLRGLARFIKATDGRLVTSFAGSAGARDAAGAWQPAQMTALVRYAATIGIPVAAAEFLNEPNLIAATGAPAGYSAADYGRDFARFANAFRAAAPRAVLLGPGAVGDGGTVEALAGAAGLKLLPSRDLLAASRTPVDAFSYHHYAGLSQRCATSGPLALAIAEARDPKVLARTDDSLARYAALRDAHAPGVPIWLTETGQAACGGSPWAATFADTPRYVDQLGRLARAGVKVHMHNTLAASDYALLDETDFSPRPSYWAALIWSRLMGSRVLAIDDTEPTTRVYAHCLKVSRGGVALVAVNLSSAAASIAFRGRGDSYVLAAADDDRGVTLNGTRLMLGPRDALPAIKGTPAEGLAAIAPYGVTFVALPNAGAQACR